MDLLNENIEPKVKEPKGKKTVLVLLILSIVLVIGIIILMVYLQANKVVPETLFINGEQKEIKADLLVSDVSGNRYISLKDLADMLEYEYDSSQYKTYITDTTKCYIKNNKLVTGFELDSKTIYKYEEDTNLDYQYYTLNHNILIYNNKLYIAVSDLPKAINAQYSVNSNNSIIINSLGYLAEAYQEKLKDTGYTIAQDQNNQKAISYGLLIVSKNGTYNVLNTNLEEAITTKYSSIYFDEQNLNFIVSSINGEYGIISTTGQARQSLRYDDLQILNYEYKLYKVKNNDKYGIMKENGTLLTQIAYDDIGFPGDSNQKILYTLIIPELNDRLNKKTIVVKQNGKYGLVYLDNGEVFLPCDHLDKLYSISDLGQVYYKIEAEKQTLDLTYYLEIRGMQTVELN